jgi:predicted regulator of Ras-like GTPase activity (Roadblock/LC7/MglB family)
VFDEILKNVFSQLEGVQCVLLAGTDGVVVAATAARNGPAPDVVAAAMAELFRKVAVAHRDAGLVQPSEFTSGGPSGQAAVRVVAADYLLIAVLDGIGSLGRTRFELRRAAAALEPELV